MERLWIGLICLNPKMNKNYFHIILLFVLIGSMFSCQKSTQIQIANLAIDSSFLKGVDVSFLPAIENSSFQFYNTNGEPYPLLSILKKSNVKLIRLRLWVNPADSFASVSKMKVLHEQAKALGFKTLLSLHYSDTWADPSAQTIPALWSDKNIDLLKKQLYAYTAQIAQDFKSDYIQIGNEINNGFLWPLGKWNNTNQFKSLIDTAIVAVRQSSHQTKIVLHYAGYSNANWFFNLFNKTDYDVIGLSYYPIWHGKDLDSLANQIQSLTNSFQKQLIVCETAYPFTLGWNDQTNNVVGLTNQLIPAFPASPEGQKAYMEALSVKLKQNPKVMGICYWGAEWVSFKGPQSTKGSSWENQAWFDFKGKALPVTMY
jgi:arabinogalactan endo-1,4-beta-galactosidase